MKLRSILYGIAILLTVVGLGAGVRQPPQPVQALGTSLCLPLPPQPSTLTYHAYFPVVFRGNEAVPVPTGCTIEEHEPNDLHDQAQPLGHCVRGNASDPLDMDWYRIEACQGPLDVEIRLAGAGDVDLYVYGDPPGYPLGASESTGGNEVLSLTHLNTGIYYVVVQAGLVSAGTYTVTVEATWSP